MTIDLSKIEDGEYVTLNDLTVRKVVSHVIDTGSKEVCLRFDENKSDYCWYSFSGRTTSYFEGSVQDDDDRSVILIGAMSQSRIMDLRVKRYSGEIAHQLESILDEFNPVDVYSFKNEGKDDTPPPLTGASMCYLGAVQRLRALKYDFECLEKPKNK